MGGGPGPKPEHLLAVLPFAEPTAIFDRIRKKHPNIKFSYHNLASADTVWKGSKNVPKGECNNPRSLRHGSRVLSGPIDGISLRSRHLLAFQRYTKILPYS